MLPPHTAATAALVNTMAVAATRMLFASCGLWAFALAPSRQPIRRWSELTPEEKRERMRRIEAPAPSRLNSCSTFRVGIPMVAPAQLYDLAAYREALAERRAAQGGDDGR